MWIVRRIIVAGLAVLPLIVQATWPSQTPWQRRLVSRVARAASIASERARPALLERLDAPDVRRMLEDCCPAVAELPAVELLQRLRDEVAVSEIVSGFDATAHQFGFSLEEAANMSHYENLWEVWIRHNISFSGFFNAFDDVETGLYGLRPFVTRGQPANQTEAQERAAYFALNSLRVDAGSPLYGDVSLVISPAAARKVSVVSPFDSGSWMGMCNSSNSSAFLPNGGYAHDCSAFLGEAGLGTLDYFDHLFLANDRYWSNGSFIRNLARIFNPSQFPLQGSDLVRYFEVLPAGKIQFPNHVKFLIASFPSLFGTEAGERLRHWSCQQGWPLVWSLGLNLGWKRSELPLFWDIKNASGPLLLNKRVMDAGVLACTTVNATTHFAEEAAFNHSWRRLAEARYKTGNTSMEPARLAQFWSQLQNGLSAELRMFPLSAGACLDAESCIGVAESGRCLCNMHSASEQGVIV